MGCVPSAEQYCQLCNTVMNVFVCLPNVQITAIASRSLERSQEFAKKHGIPKAYSSYVELANDPDIGEYWAMICLHRERERKKNFLLLLFDVDPGALVF